MTTNPSNEVDLGGLDKPSPKQTPEAAKSVTHVHDWRLMRKSDLSTRFANAQPTRETLIDLVLDPGDSSELWTCPDCGEDRFKYRPGLYGLLAKPKVTTAASPDHEPTKTKRERYEQQ